MKLKLMTGDYIDGKRAPAGTVREFKTREESTAALATGKWARVPDTGQALVEAPAKADKK